MFESIVQMRVILNRKKAERIEELPTDPVLKLRSPRRPSTFSTPTCDASAAHNHTRMGITTVQS